MATRVEMELHAGMRNHAYMYNRDAEDQHPMSAITDLEDELDRLEHMAIMPQYKLIDTINVSTAARTAYRRLTSEGDAYDFTGLAIVYEAPEGGTDIEVSVCTNVSTYAKEDCLCIFRTGTGATHNVIELDGRKGLVIPNGTIVSAPGAYNVKTAPITSVVVYAADRMPAGTTIKIYGLKSE